jgi:hypothetical protein
LKHVSLCFLDGHHHPLPHKPQLDALGREMVDFLSWWTVDFLCFAS